MFNIGNTKEELLAGIGERVRSQRLTRRLTQAELAARTGLSKRSIERLESGVGNPRLEVLVAICMEFSLVTGFNMLLPEVRLRTEDILAGRELPKRARKRRVKALKWGDGK